MQTHAVLYVNPWPAPLWDADAPSVQAQLVACRVYAVARGLSVVGVHAAAPAGSAQWAQVAATMLEQVQNTIGSAEGDRLQTVVVYDQSDMQDSNGSWDRIAHLLRVSGVRLESALPPHTVAAGAWEMDPRWRTVLSGMFSMQPQSEEQRRARAAVRPPVTLAPAAWQGFVDLLGDEERLRALVAKQRLCGEATRLRQKKRLAKARQDEWEREGKKNDLLDLLLEGVLSRAACSAQVQALETELLALRVERRQRHAAVAASALSPLVEEQVVEVARCVRRTLEQMTVEEQQQVAGLLQMQCTPTGKGVPMCACWLPLVDESQREEVVWSSKKEKGVRSLALTVPPLGGPNATAEDYPLLWKVPAPAQERSALRRPARGVVARTEEGAPA